MQSGSWTTSSGETSLHATLFLRMLEQNPRREVPTWWGDWGSPANSQPASCEWPEGQGTDQKLGLLMWRISRTSQKHPAGLLPIPALQEVVEEPSLQVSTDSYQNEMLRMRKNEKGLGELIRQGGSSKTKRRNRNTEFRPVMTNHQLLSFQVKMPLSSQEQVKARKFPEAQWSNSRSLLRARFQLLQSGNQDPTSCVVQPKTTKQAKGVHHQHFCCYAVQE